MLKSQIGITESSSLVDRLLFQISEKIDKKEPRCLCISTVLWFMELFFFEF